MIFIDANILGSSRISSDWLFASKSVVIITIGKLLSVNVCAFEAYDNKKKNNIKLFNAERKLKGVNFDILNRLNF